MAKTQLPENEKLWVWDNYTQGLYLTDVGAFSRKFNKENDPKRYYVISIDPDTDNLKIKPIIATEEHMASRDLVTINTTLGQRLTCTTDSELMTYKLSNPTHKDGSIRIIGEEYKLTTTDVKTADCALSPHSSDIFTNDLITDMDRDYAYLIANYLLYGKQIAASHVLFDANPNFDPERFTKIMSRVSGQKINGPRVQYFENKEPMAYIFELPDPYASCVFGAYCILPKLKTLQPDKLVFPMNMYSKMSLSSPSFMKHLMETLFKLDKTPVFHNRRICQQVMLCNMLYSTHLTPKITPRVNNLDEIEYIMSYDNTNETDWVSEDVTDNVQKIRTTARTYGNSLYLSTYEITVKDTDNFLTADCIFVKS